MHTKKIIFIILGITIIIASFFLLNFIKQRNIEINRIEEQKRIEAELNSNVENAEKHYGNDYKRMKAAVKENNIFHCNKLADYSFDECVFDIASINSDYSLCSEIKEEKIKTKCMDLQSYQESIDSFNISLCLTVKTDSLRNQCENEIFKQNSELKYCEKIKDSDLNKKCLDYANNSLALDNKSIEHCEKIFAEKIKNECKSLFNIQLQDSDNDGLQDTLELSFGTNAFKADTDGDGLNDLEEMSKFFTDPNKADTDGDGFNDGEELKNGYDPLR
jgi:hypothetical protein